MKLVYAICVVVMGVLGAYFLIDGMVTVYKVPNKTALDYIFLTCGAFSCAGFFARLSN